MQSYYSNKTQPYPLAGYPIFVAEVASTFNEALLIDHMLEQIKDDATRLSLLGSYLENIKSTVFRQTQFAEFELRMHERAQLGMPLTGDALAKLYSDITRNTTATIRASVSWTITWPTSGASFPTSTATSTYSSTRHRSPPHPPSPKRCLPETGRRRNAIWRSCAPADPNIPIDLLKDAGVDMTTDEPLDLTVRKMNRVMDEMEKLLAKMPAAKPKQ